MPCKLHMNYTYMNMNYTYNQGTHVYNSAAIGDFLCGLQIMEERQDRQTDRIDWIGLYKRDNKKSPKANLSSLNKKKLLSFEECTT